jgi:hypothetical protein
MQLVYGLLFDQIYISMNLEEPIVLNEIITINSMRCPGYGRSSHIGSDWSDARRPVGRTLFLRFFSCWQPSYQSFTVKLTLN